MKSLQQVLHRLHAELDGMMRTLAATNRQVGDTLAVIRAERAARARQLAAREQRLATRRALRAGHGQRHSG